MNISKKISYALICAFILTGGAYAQEGGGDLNVSENTPVTPPVEMSFDESLISLAPRGAELGQTESSVSTFWLFARMILVLAAVVACIYGVLWLFKRSMRTQDGDDPFLRFVSSAPLGNGKSAAIITLVDRAYIVGVAENSVNLIAEVADKELVDAMNLYSDEHKNVKKPRSFADILDIFMPGGPRDKGGVFGSSQNKLSDMLERQRERIKGGE
ncbi:MAG: FliO/MopB family protein [Treponema sp.]